jgi:hypothetical protein
LADVPAHHLADYAAYRGDADPLLRAAILDDWWLALLFIDNCLIVLLYPFVQRYFIRGITVGAVKG